jgi:hypothetical protein
MDYRNLTAPCGKDCFNCPLYIGEENKANRRQFFEKNKLTEDKFQCKGCRNNNGYCLSLEILGIDPNCKTYKCVQSKKVEFCFECDEFPCFRLQPLADRSERVPHGLKIYNLCMIKRMGVEKWASEYSKKIFEDYYQRKLDSCM